MKLPRHFLAALALALAASARAAVVFDLDAAALPAGATSEVQDKSGAGRWVANVPVRVGNAQGRPAFVFDGTQQLISEFALPDGAEKDRPFTVETWVLNPTLEKSETVLSFAPARGGAGTEFNFAASASDGAFRSGFKATAPFSEPPSAGSWHHIAWSYSAGGLRVYVDGELAVERPLHVQPPPGARFHVGASGEVDNKGPRKGFSGSIARVRLHDAALSQAEIRTGAGFLTAFAPSPRNGATTDSLDVTLRWRRGRPDAAAFALHVGTDRAAVERGDPALEKKVGTEESSPLQVRAGTQYFWRVDQLDREGHTTQAGPVWTFNADPGLTAEPQPRNSDSNVAPGLTTLSWKPGRYATHQRVFLGTASEEVRNATKPAAELSGEATAFTLPARLTPGTRYFWRVDSDNGPQPPSRGAIWTFRTQDAPVPDDVTFFVSSDTHYGRENNAAINRRVIDEMNALPGTPLPDAIGGGNVRTPFGVVLNGDLLDEGFNSQTAPALWAEFCRDYGLTGKDGRLAFPVYEGFGNHDGGPVKSITRAGIKERNPRRVGVDAISPDGHHYSWDWQHVHLVQLNLFGGSGPADVKGVNPVEHDPQAALDFLRDDLAKHAGSPGRRVVVFQHFAWTGGMSDWWQPEAKERFYEVVKPYSIACLINGHSHGAGFMKWHDLPNIHDGSTARGEGDTGDFMVVRITAGELIVAQRKIGGWGIHMRIPLPANGPAVKP